MMMHLETKHRRAFQKLQEAQLSLTSFQQSKARSDLTTAGAKLNEALNLDPNYLRAFYYRGLVRDMLGEAEQAAKDFSLVLEQHPPFLSEVRYNLGVATFHQYGHANLQLAITHFEDVIESTNRPALRLRASAFLAHAYAVMMIPRPKEKTDDCRKINEFLASPEARKHVSTYHELSVNQSEALESDLEAEEDLDSSTRDEISWRVCNTRAVQRMFYTDYFDDDRMTRLREAEETLLEADKLNPRNWSIYCNLGSTYMRLGHWLKTGGSEVYGGPSAEEYFDKAIKSLDTVIAELLPDYGFAFYEKARVYRLRGKFAVAEVWLRKAWEVKKNRAVSNQTLQCELERINLGRTDYPFLGADPSESSAR